MRPFMQRIEDNVSASQAANARLLVLFFHLFTR